MVRCKPYRVVDRPCAPLFTDALGVDMAMRLQMSRSDGPRTAVASESLPSPITFQWLPPPFTHFEPLYPGSAKESGDLPFGSLVVATVEGGVAEWPVVQAAINRVRLLMPGFALVMLIKNAARADTAFLATRGARHGIRATLVEGEEDLRPALVRQLLSPADLASDILEWLDSPPRPGANR